MNNPESILPVFSRRDFLRLTGSGVGAFFARRFGLNSIESAMASPIEGNKNKRVIEKWLYLSSLQEKPRNQEQIEKLREYCAQEGNCTHFSGEEQQYRAVKDSTTLGLIYFNSFLNLDLNNAGGPNWRYISPQEEQLYKQCIDDLQRSNQSINPQENHFYLQIPKNRQTLPYQSLKDPNKFIASVAKPMPYGIEDIRPHGENICLIDALKNLKEALENPQQSSFDGSLDDPIRKYLIHIIRQLSYDGLPVFEDKLGEKIGDFVPEDSRYEYILNTLLTRVPKIGDCSEIAWASLAYTLLLIPEHINSIYYGLIVWDIPGSISAHAFCVVEFKKSDNKNLFYVFDGYCEDEKPWLPLGPFSSREEVQQALGKKQIPDRKPLSSTLYELKKGNSEIIFEPLIEPNTDPRFRQYTVGYKDGEIATKKQGEPQIEPTSTPGPTLEPNQPEIEPGKVNDPFCVAGIAGAALTLISAINIINNAQKRSRP